MKIFGSNMTEFSDPERRVNCLADHESKGSNLLSLIMLFSLFSLNIFTLCGCIGTGSFNITKVGFAECIRLDRQPATCDPGDRSGSYVTGRENNQVIISEVYPSSMRKGAPENLIVSDCLWLGRESADWMGGDFIHMSWEAIVGFASEDGEPIFQGNNLFGVCRFENPQGREPVGFDAWNPEHMTVENGEETIFTLAMPDPEDGFDGQRPANWPWPPERVADFETFYYPYLTEYHNIDANPDGQCLGHDDRMASNWNTSFHFDGSPSRVKRTSNDHRNLSCITTASGRVPACGNCEMKPLEDSSYRLSANDSVTMERWISPNIMVVPGERKIARMMTVDSQDDRRYTWSTPVNPTRRYWHENFSSNLRVKQVRLLERAGGSGGTTISSQTLRRLEIFDPNDENVIYNCVPTWIESRQEYEMVFDLGGSCFRWTREDENDWANPFVTPTYDTDRLDAEPGNPLVDPLNWQIEFESSPANNVYVEFTLEYQRGTAALMMTKAYIDFEQVQIEESRQVYARGLITNIGGDPMRIDKITVVGEPQYNAPEETFTYRLPYDPRTIPIPVEMDIPGDQVESDSAAVMSVALGKDVEDFGLLEVMTEKDCRNEDITVVKPLIVGNKRNIFDEIPLSERLSEMDLRPYGETLELDGQFAFFANPNADFESLAVANTPAG